MSKKIQTKQSAPTRAESGPPQAVSSAATSTPARPPSSDGTARATDSTEPIQESNIGAIVKEAKATSLTRQLTPDALKLDVAHHQLAVNASEQSMIPLGAPNKQLFFRVASALSMLVCLLDWKADGFSYLLTQTVQRAISEADVKFVKLYVWVDRRDNVGVWAVGVPYSDGTNYDAWKSGHKVCERAKTEWVKKRWNRQMGVYDIVTLHPSVEAPKPNFPELTMEEVVERVFEGRIIDSVDHPIIRELQGLM